MLREIVLLLGLRRCAAFVIAPPFRDTLGRNLACRHGGSHKAHEEKPRGLFGYFAARRLEDSARKHAGVAAATALLLLSTNAVTVLPASATEKMGTQQNTPLVVAAAEPLDIDDAAKKILQEAFDALREGNIPEAETSLAKSIKLWEAAQRPAEEIAGLYQTRAELRAGVDLAQGSAPAQQSAKSGRKSSTSGSDERTPISEAAAGALADFGKALELYAIDDALETPLGDPSALPRTLLGRAEVARRLNQWELVNRDLEAAEASLDRLPRVAQTNPFLYQRRAEARMRLGQWSGAVDDALEAEAEFNLIGDKIRRTLAAADAALALYGDGQFEEASEKMVQVFRQKGQPTSNSPDDIPLLQELSRRDAELHLAFAADQWWRLHDQARAALQWESGCIRLEAYTEDAASRALALEFREDVTIPTSQGTVADSAYKAWRTNPFTAKSMGLPEDSPYVTQKPGQAYFYYKVGADGRERRDAESVAAVTRAAQAAAAARDSPELRLSGLRFRDPAWVARERPAWPPQLREALIAFDKQVPPVPLVMPPKGGPLSKGELEFELPEQKGLYRKPASVAEVRSGEQKQK